MLFEFSVWIHMFKFSDLCWVSSLPLLLALRPWCVLIQTSSLCYLVLLSTAFVTCGQVNVMCVQGARPAMLDKSLALWGLIVKWRFGLANMSGLLGSGILTLTLNDDPKKFFCFLKHAGLVLKHLLFFTAACLHGLFSFFCWDKRHRVKCLSPTGWPLGGCTECWGSPR